METSEMQSEVKSRLQWQSTEDWQIEESKPTLKLLTSESDSFTLYVIGWTDFWKIMSDWSDDILNRIIKKIVEDPKQNKEERKIPSSTATSNNRRDLPENSKMSELFDMSLKRLWLDLEEVNMIRCFDDILAIEQPQQELVGKKLFPILRYRI